MIPSSQEKRGDSTREESEDLVSALVDHVDAQLVLSLACFLALGPAEIRGLQWGDIDRNWLHIRRNVVLGKEGTTKTIERAASLPLLDEVRVPLELWRAKCEAKGDSDSIIPDLHNLLTRVIKPHVFRAGQQSEAKTIRARTRKLQRLQACNGEACTAHGEVQSPAPSMPTGISPWDKRFTRHGAHRQKS